MKILFYLRINVMGGAERYLLKLLPELKKRNIEVGFFCTRQSNNKEIVDYFIEHFNHYEIPVYVSNAIYTYSLKTAYYLSQIIKKERYNILSAHLMHAEIISGLSKSLFKTPCKLVTTKHGYLQRFMDQYGLDYSKINKLSVSYLVEKSLQQFVSGNFAVSQGLADFYVRSGICKASKMEVIYHGMDAHPGKGNASPVRYSDNQLLVVARLKKFKGHVLLLEAVKILSKELPDLKLVILGVGEEMKSLVDIVRESQLDHFVYFAGYTDNVYDYINGSDVIVVPSLAEPFGLIVLEAYSCARPIIGFDVPALNENVIDGETGCLVIPYDTKALAACIKSLLQNKAVARKMGENGLALLKNKFSLNISVERTITFYQQSLK